MERRVNIGNSLQNEVPVIPAVAFDSNIARSLGSVTMNCNAADVGVRHGCCT